MLELNQVRELGSEQPAGQEVRRHVKYGCVPVSTDLQTDAFYRHKLDPHAVACLESEWKDSGKVLKLVIRLNLSLDLVQASTLGLGDAGRRIVHMNGAAVLLRIGIISSPAVADEFFGEGFFDLSEANQGEGRPVNPWLVGAKAGGVEAGGQMFPIFWTSESYMVEVTADRQSGIQVFDRTGRPTRLVAQAQAPCGSGLPDPYSGESGRAGCRRPAQS